MRKAVACELGDSVDELDCVVDLNSALRMVWGSTSGVGWEEARWPAGRDSEEGRPSFFVLPGVSLSLLWETGSNRVTVMCQTQAECATLESSWVETAWNKSNPITECVITELYDQRQLNSLPFISVLMQIRWWIHHLVGLVIKHKKKHRHFHWNFKEIIYIKGIVQDF